MRKIVLLFASLLVITFAPQVRAEVPPPSVFLSHAIVYPYSFTDKAGAPVSSLNAVSVLVPVSPSWLLLGKTGFATGYSAFQPAPQVHAGGGYRLSDRVLFTTAVVYRYVPHWKGTAGDAHLLSLVLTTPIKITDGIGIGFPVGITRNFTASKWLGSVSTEFYFRIP